MEKNKPGFEEFIATVDSGCQPFVRELHDELTGRGCKIEIKEAKSGYVASYLFRKKTVANYVSRKRGLIARLYANHIDEYNELMDTLPEGLTGAVQKAPVCKRLVNPEACNPKCPTGYDFVLKGQRQQKCRYSAFMIPVDDQNNPFIRALLLRELEACSHD